MTSTFSPPLAPWASKRSNAERDGSLAPSARFALWCVLAPICLDYRFPQPTAVTLAIYTVLTLLSVTGTCMLILRSGLQRGSSATWTAGTAFVFAAVSISVGLLYGQDIAQVVRVSPPLVLLPCAILATSALRAAGDDPRAIWRDVLLATFFGMIAQMILAFAVGHVSLSTARYQVLAAAAPIATGYGLGIMLFGGFSFIAIPVLALHLGSILISVTRTQLVVAAAPAVLAVVVTGGRPLRRKRALGVAAAVPFAALIIAAIGAATPESPIDRWEQRLFSQSAHHNYDITALTRIGEARYQIQHMEADPVRFLTGFGIAAPTAFDSQVAVLIEELIGDNQGSWGETGFGHNHYVGTIFVGGLVAGGALLFAQLRALGCSLIAMRRLSASGLLTRYRAFTYFLLSYVAFDVFGTLGGLLGSRGSSVAFGFTLGMSLWAYEVLPPFRSSAARVTR